MTSLTFLTWLYSCTMVLQMLSVSQMLVLWGAQFDISGALILRWRQHTGYGGLVIAIWYRPGHPAQSPVLIDESTV